MPLLQADADSASSRPRWLGPLLLVLVGFLVWALFSLWPWLTTPAAPFRVREAWDTGLFWSAGVPAMLLAQVVAGALGDGKLVAQPAPMLGGLVAGVVLVHSAGNDLGLLPLTFVFIGLPAYVALLAATGAGRIIRDAFE